MIGISRILACGLAIALALNAGQHFALKSSKLKRQSLEAKISVLEAENTGLREGQTDAAVVAQLAAQACKSNITVRVNHSREAETVRNAEDMGISPARAYDMLLCRRPEAAGHPACTAEDPG